MKDNKHESLDINSVNSSADCQSVLTKIFRSLLLQITNITPTRESGDKLMQVFNVMLERYIISSFSNRRDIASLNNEIVAARGNLRKELTRPTMSWKVFIKALKFLGTKRFEINITITTNNGSKFTHTQAVNIQNIDLLDFVDE